jgi:hypothetical protein
MEGGLLLHVAWALSFAFMVIYRRWFEKSAPRSAEFEAFCATRPLLAALLVRRGSERAVAERLAAALPRGETLAIHGAWPWVYYVLAVDWVAGNGVVHANIRACRVLRTRETRPPSFTHLLAATLAANGDAQEAWLHRRAYVDVSGRSLGECGWRVARAGSAKRPCVEWEATPTWVSASNSRGSLVAPGFTPSPLRPQLADS